jgi:antitoxin component YwqK of YwqJK toxin-antitoxin module
MRLLAVLFLFCGVQSMAQWKSFELSPRGDTLNRVDKQGMRQGPWVIAVPELRGERGYEEQGYFVNDKKEGEWTKFSVEGIKIADEQYRWGLLNGRQKYYTPFGGLARTESWRALDPANAFDTVLVYDLNDPNKVIGQVVVKNEGASFKHGPFVYYDPRTGKVEQKVEYVMNKLKEEGVGSSLMPLDPRMKPTYTPTLDSTGNKKVSKPGVIQDFEKKNSGKKSIRVRDGATGGF